MSIWEATEIRLKVQRSEKSVKVNMKCAIAVVFVTLVLFLSPSDGAESDVLRIFDPDLKMTDQEMEDILKNANLQEYGFVKTEEVTTKKDENGKTTTVKVILYSVTDECSSVEYWEGILKRHLPDKLISSKMASDVVKGVQSRAQGRNTKYCVFSLEVHRRIVPETQLRPKRAVSGASARCLWSCCRADIAYE